MTPGPLANVMYNFVQHKCVYVKLFEPRSLLAQMRSCDHRLSLIN